ncbi:hypothetical protein [Paracoccus aerius]|uniref:Uncharacterized protein n=2 Tax=Paracoccus aerius TaxID=1915382 RepID=A0ABS1S609_9RHOB|nr:hypothetical protein [Paracoccus aerius]MBL3674166.1 hypothetical protein [Paracoccus aerius]
MMRHFPPIRKRLIIIVLVTRFPPDMLGITALDGPAVPPEKEIAFYLDEVHHALDREHAT